MPNLQTEALDLETCPLNEPQPGSQGCSGMKRSKKGAMVFTKATEDRWVSGMGLSALGALVMGSRRRSFLTQIFLTHLAAIREFQVRI